MKRWFRGFVPALVTFGPLFMTFTATQGGALGRIYGYLGALGLAVGLATIVRVLGRQHEEIERLKAALATAAD